MSDPFTTDDLLDVTRAPDTANFSVKVRLTNGDSGTVHIGPQDAMRPDRDEWIVRRLNETSRIAGDQFLEELGTGWHA